MFRLLSRIRRKRKLAILRKRELNQMLPEERRKKVTELRAELTTIRTSVKSGGTVDNPARIRELRKTIARLLTLENMPAKPSPEAA
jgi:large subunit ribosomal protein L29